MFQFTDVFCSCKDIIDGSSCHSAFCSVKCQKVGTSQGSSENVPSEREPAHGDHYLVADRSNRIPPHTHSSCEGDQIALRPVSDSNWVQMTSFCCWNNTNRAKGWRGGMMEEKTTCTLFSFIDELLYFYSLKRTWWHVEEMESKCCNQARNSWSCEKTVCQAWFTRSHTLTHQHVFSSSSIDLTLSSVQFKVPALKMTLLRENLHSKTSKSVFLCFYTLLEAGVPQTVLKILYFHVRGFKVFSNLGVGNYLAWRSVRWCGNLTPPTHTHRQIGIGG